MTDKELLELAAKACGFKKVSATYHSDDDGYPTSEFWYMHVKDLYDGKSGSSCIWNPLTDDGDALRLAVKLNINPQQYPIYLKEKHSAIAIMHIDIENDISGIATYQECGNDPYAATRRAIVCAAAEIGKEKP